MAFTYKRKIKKRHWVIALLCIEIGSIPISASLIKHINNFKVKQVIAVMIDEKPGQKRFAVASTESFSIKAQNYEGPIFISAENDKKIGVVTFGENAHLPFPARRCSYVTPLNQTIYQSQKGTIAAEGHISTQAIVITIDYDVTNIPEINFTDGKETRLTPDLSSECLLKLA